MYMNYELKKWVSKCEYYKGELIMDFNLIVTLDETISNRRRKEYLIKNGDKLMFLFRIITPPSYLEDFSPTYKFEPVLSIGLIPDIACINNEIHVFYEENQLVPLIRDDDINQFIEDTAFAKETVSYILKHIIPKYTFPAKS